MRGMRDGELRVIRSVCTNLPFEVVAQRVDSETPYVLLRNSEHHTVLTDVQTQELIERLRRALHILPSSK